ncbi:Zinc finger transcription factor KRAB-E2S, partial [Operophtera brumata]
MAVCESSQLESGLARIKRDESDDTSQERPLPTSLPLTVDYRSPVSHFVPPAVELYAARQKQEQVSSEALERKAKREYKRRGTAGSPGAASDSLSLDENLRALRHIHEKYANIDKKPPMDGVQRTMDDDVMSVRSSDDPERLAEPAAATSHDEISESDNESPDKSYQCHICKKWAEAHRGAMTIRCSVCRRCFEHDDELAAHKALHTQDERDGRCSQCTASFDTWDQLKRHVSSAHSPPRAASPGGGGAHACAHCGKRFTHVHSLTRHLQNHAKQLYRCVVCKVRTLCALPPRAVGARFTHVLSLTRHLQNHAKQLYRCVVCKVRTLCALPPRAGGARFTHVLSLTRHLQNHAKQLYRCVVCKVRTLCALPPAQGGTLHARALAHAPPAEPRQAALPLRRLQGTYSVRTPPRAGGARFTHVLSLTCHLQNHAKQLYRCVVCKVRTLARGHASRTCSRSRATCRTTPSSSTAASSA